MAIENEQLSFLEQVYKVSPPVFALVVFFIVAVFLHKLGLLNFRDPVEERWRDKIQGEIEDLKTKVAILDDRWGRK